MATNTQKLLLGTYVGVPDNGDPAAEAVVYQQYNSFVGAMGQAPVLMNTYVDDSLAETQWVSDAQWEADSWSSFAWSQPLIPVIGLPMASQGEDADQSFKKISSGAEDSIFKGVFQAWASDGYSQFYIRPGYEMNGTWMPWSVTQSNAADYVAAFQHIANLAHAFTGASIQVVWNPNVGPIPVPLSQLYPGNAAVDVIGLDTYGAPVDTGASPGNTSTDPGTLTLLDSLVLAKANGKPFALPETGGTDPSFPSALASVIAGSGVPVAFMNIWDINDQSGNLSWSNPSDNAAATAAAWKQAFQTIAVVDAKLVAPTPTPTPTPTATASPNDTVVLAGSAAAIVDASGNSWTISSGGQVAVNGIVDPVTASVIELAYVNGTIWQENSSKLWWGVTKPGGSWEPTTGTSVNPLPAPIRISASQTSATVTKSQVSVVASSGSHMVFIKGSGDIVSLSGGTNTIADTGHGNTYILPVAGKGTDIFTSDILNSGDTLDLAPALAKTNWNGSAATLSNYLHVTETGKGSVISLSSLSKGPVITLATIQGGNDSLSFILAHSIT